MLEFFRKMSALKHRDDEGASAVEYGLLIAGIAALIVIVVFAFGGTIKSIFSGTCNGITSKMTGGGVTLSGSSCS